MIRNVAVSALCSCLDRESILNEREWGINTKPAHTATLALLKMRRHFPQRTAIPWVTLVTKTCCVNMVKLSSYWGVQNWFTSTCFSSSQPDLGCAHKHQAPPVSGDSGSVIALLGKAGSAAKRAGFRGAAVNSQGPEQNIMTQAGSGAALTEPGSPRIKYCPVITRRKQSHPIATPAKSELAELLTNLYGVTNSYQKSKTCFVSAWIHQQNAENPSFPLDNPVFSCFLFWCCSKKTMEAKPVSSSVREVYRPLQSMQLIKNTIKTVSVMRTGTQ